MEGLILANDLRLSCIRGGGIKYPWEEGVLGELDTTLYYDFVKQVYGQASSGTGIASVAESVVEAYLTRASNALVLDTSGNFTEVSSGELARSDKSLLLQESRQNKINTDLTTWSTAGGASVSAEGTQKGLAAYRLSGPNSGDLGSRIFTFPSHGSNVVFSAVFGDGAGAEPAIELTASSNRHTVSINMSTGVTTIERDALSAIDDHYSEDLGSGVWRLVMECSGLTAGFGIIHSDFNGADDVLVCGAHLENGVFATTPVLGNAQTRARDDFNWTGLGTFIADTGSAHWAFVEFGDRLQDTGDAYGIAITDGSGADPHISIRHDVTNGDVVARIEGNSGVETLTYNATLSETDTIKALVRTNGTNDHELYVNGASRATGTTALTISTDYEELRLGQNESDVSSSGYIKKVYVGKGAITDTQANDLTT